MAIIAVNPRSCCTKNQHKTGFYGPPGCRTLEEAGGRVCSCCGCSETVTWYLDATQHGFYRCSM